MGKIITMHDFLKYRYTPRTGSWLSIITLIAYILTKVSVTAYTGGIFNLAVAGLGKYTAQASGIFMMMVVGGGIFPLLQQFISDAVGYMASY